MKKLLLFLAIVFVMFMLAMELTYADAGPDVVRSSDFRQETMSILWPREGKMNLCYGEVTVRGMAMHCIPLEGLPVETCLVNRVVGGFTFDCEINI